MTLREAMRRLSLQLAWRAYADRLSYDERQVRGGLLHRDNWIDPVYTPGGKRWSELGL